jgi:hypothetical protein
MSLHNFKALGVLLLLIFVNSISMDAQEKYYFTLNSKQDTVVVYDAHDNIVLLYGKDVFVYRQTPIKIIGDKKKVFSTPDKELGKMSSKKYRKIYLTDGSMYVLASGKKKLAYKKDGRVCADAKYSCNSSCPYLVGDRVDVEMSIDDTDLNFIPFLFQSVLAHIQGTKDMEQLVWLSSGSTLFY